MTGLRFYWGMLGQISYLIPLCIRGVGYSIGGNIVNQIKKHYSMEDILRDTKHNAKANKVFLHLMAKNKMPRNPFEEFRGYSLPSTGETKPGADTNDIL